MKTFVSPVFAPNRFLIGISFGFVAGFFEEIGWMGYAFPKMCRAGNALAPAILLGLLWGARHIPVVDYLGTSTPHGHYWFPFFLAFTALVALHASPGAEICNDPNRTCTMIAETGVPMDELRFRIVGISTQQVHSWRKSTEPGPSQSPLLQRVARRWRDSSHIARILVVLTVVVAGDYILSAQPSIHDIAGRRVLVLLDTSGSMGNTGERTNQQLTALKAHNISVTEPYSTNGYAISSAHTGYSFLQPLQNAVSASPLSDTIYVISDFKGGDQEDNDVAGYQQLRDLLRQRRLTLYLCTVDQLPPLPVYYEIAAASGGGVIEEYKNPQQER